MVTGSTTITHVSLAKDFNDNEQQVLLLLEAMRKNTIKQQLVVRLDSKLHHICKDIDYADIVAITRPFVFSLSVISKSDLLHAHEKHAAYWCYLAKKIYDIPYLISYPSSNRPKNNIVARSIYNQASCLLSPSRTITEVLHSYQPDLQIEVIPRMFKIQKSDETAVRKIRQKYRGKYVVCCVSNSGGKQNGHNYLIDAVRKLISHYPHMRFIILDRKKDEVEIRQQAQSIDQIEFVNSENTLHDYMAISDQFVFHSLQQVLGSSLIDAMHFGMPIVASATSGVTDIIQDLVTGLIVPSRSSDKLARAIESLYKSTAVAKKLGQCASRASHRHSMKNVSDKVFEIYRGIITERH